MFENDTFAPVVPRVPGQFSRCPCGVGAYDIRSCTDRFMLHWWAGTSG